MDDIRFDALARSLILGSSRRHLTRLAGGLTLAGVPMLAGEPPVAAKRKKKKKKPHPPTGGCSSGCPGGQVCRAGACECPQAAPHWCASANTCVPACPTGMVFDQGSCGCECAVKRSCCECRGGASPFCTTDINDPNQCAAACGQGGLPFFAAWTAAGQTGVCGASNRCDLTCSPVTRREEFDACKGGGDCQCRGDLKCFQPLGGGPLRCGRSTNPAPSCGCTSHQQCADNHGIGAFCVQITGNQCSCGGASTFCATQA